MSYLSESSKWNAYQFNDPFASDKFIVCNKTTKICCRPNCDLSLQTSLKTEVVFFDTAEEASNAGYIQCPHCLISGDNNDDLNTISIDVELLIKTVATVNSQIGFVPPLDDDDPQSQSIREAVMRRSKLRRGSVPAIHLNSTTASKNSAASITKNETDHVKLVDLACRHIALAAASTALQIHEDQNNVVRKQLRQQEQQQQLLEDKANGSKKRRRRGGVLGFKELASKSKLSPWHFHRVFKSVTGLTPKVYGDKCWEFVKKYIDRHGSFSSQNAITMSTSITNPTSSPPDEQTTGVNTMALLVKASNNKAAKSNEVVEEANNMISPSDFDIKRESPFSITTEDFTSTSQSSNANSLMNNQYESPLAAQKMGLGFNANNLLPLSNNDLLLEQPENLLVDQIFSGTEGSLNSFDILYNNSQPQFQDYQFNLQLPAQNQKNEMNNITLDHSRTKSAPTNTLENLDLPEFEIPTQVSKDWNFIHYQNPAITSNPSQSNEFDDVAAAAATAATDFNDSHYSLEIPSTYSKANSDAGEYIQTPFNLDMNTYGYFGDFTTLDHMEPAPTTLEFMS